MILILLGPPGIGKGTQASVLSDILKINHIATGDIFRKNFKENTELGILSKKFIAQGLLVPDDITNQMIADYLSKDLATKDFLLDGFPRNVLQARFLDDFFKNSHLFLTKVIYFNAGTQDLMKRIVGRRICPECGKVYHIENIPPKTQGICDKDQKTLIQREDDKPETFLKRLKVFNQETLPLVQYYREQNQLFEVDGMQNIDQVTKMILEVLETDRK
ncbi:adenylate kinase [Paulownia witches'-broom phytoplasma]|uniref:Adenylate kinase n=1 Tax=Paulownia witches'-broom phytoplasma TaxID=39647 RepID=E3SFV5_9MOLU|nr:adenylate kinase [Paulownia witches'-broom phytoplasma]ADO33814.1 adenylate kinase [Paulownia witches'-broom phytoplasma]QYC31030.1 adenylate kinase [Paulownia witches'-broom phytoplasma]GLH60753.1 adenylate kinase [Paulownia witches'-broom phytoplasma]